MQRIAPKHFLVQFFALLLPVLAVVRRLDGVDCRQGDAQDLQENLDIDMIAKSLNKAIKSDSDDEDYIIQKRREDYFSDSTVTIHLIGTKSGETLGNKEQKYIKRELQASLYNGKGNT